MTKITLKGNEIHTNGNIPKIGDEAPDFVLVNEDLNNVTLEEYKNKNKILSIVPSLDTPVCQTSTKVFNEKASSLKDTIILTISADLPFIFQLGAVSHNSNYYSHRCLCKGMGYWYIHP